MLRAADDRRIRELHDRGLRPVAIAVALKLTPEAVRGRLIALGLRPNARGAATASPIDVVLAQLDRPAQGCWIWPGPFLRKHPVVFVGGANPFVARVLWEHFRAPMPQPLRSTCGEPRCVRPEHREETRAGGRTPSRTSL